jgi:hypothetical protein
MTSHTLEAIKGWPSPHAVDFAATLSANVTNNGNAVYAGRVAHLVFAQVTNLAGVVSNTPQYELGLLGAPTAVGNAANPTGNIGRCDMPIFLFQNSDDPDVSNPGGNPATDVGVWVAVSPTGKIMGLVAAGAYELETTEFVPEATLGSTYTPGSGLTAIQNNTNGDGGLVTKGVAYNVPLCGVVSRGVRKNSYAVNALSFWPVWLPTNNAGA